MSVICDVFKLDPSVNCSRLLQSLNREVMLFIEVLLNADILASSSEVSPTNIEFISTN